MSSPRAAGASRRRQRSVRVTVAVCLLVIAALVVVGALVVGSLLVTSVAAVLALLCGAAATRIVLNELTQSRRDAARDRAQQASAYGVTFAKRIAEHDRFALGMTSRLGECDAKISRLVAAVRLADDRATAAQRTAAREAQRTAELQQRLDATSRALMESAAMWDRGEQPAVVDLLAWEERVAAAHTGRHEGRRRA